MIIEGFDKIHKCIYTTSLPPLLGALNSQTWVHTDSRISTQLSSYCSGLDPSLLSNPSYFHVRPLHNTVAEIKYQGVQKYYPEPQYLTFSLLYNPYGVGDLQVNLENGAVCNIEFVICNSSWLNSKLCTLKSEISVKSSKIDSVYCVKIKNGGWKLLQITVDTSVFDISSGVSLKMSFNHEFVICMADSMNLLQMKNFHSTGSNGIFIPGSVAPINMLVSAHPMPLSGSMITPPPTNVGVYGSPPQAHSYNGTSAYYKANPSVYGVYKILPKDLPTFIPVEPDELTLTSNQGRTTCFKCGTKTKKVDTGMFSVYDICPKCKV